jgi:hypothetical protein
MPHSGMPVSITQAAGTIEVPTSDLMQFAQELCRIHDQPPLEPHGKVKEFLDMAIAAAIAEDRKVRISEVLAEYTEEMQRKLEHKFHQSIARTIFG